MMPKTEDELLKLQNTVIQNFTIFQSSVENFMENNNKLLNMYLESVDYEQRLSVKIYKDYMTGLLSMLVKSTDFIKDMMLKAQNTTNILFNSDPASKSSSKKNEENSWETSSLSSVASELTVTGYKNGFSNVNHDRALTQLVQDMPFNHCSNHDSKSLNAVKYNPGLPYKRTNISHFKSGSVIKRATVTSTMLDGKFFHISLTEGPDHDVLSKLYRATDRISYKNPPVAGIIFGIKIDGGILRAIRCQPVSTGKIFLLDFGDIVDICKSLENIYYLTKEEQKIPAEAVLCKLHCPKGTAENEVARGCDHLDALLYKQVSFVVVENVNGVLGLEILQIEEEQLSTQSHTSPSLNMIPSEDVDNTTELKQPMPSLEELESLYEDPTCTSNALTAVIGYVPKDDRKICRFYDPKIDGCFKGNTCRQLHVPLRKDYISKDVVVANAYSVPLGETIHYDADQVLQVTVTHIRNFAYFYGIIGSDEPIIFEDRDVPTSDYLRKLPYEFDIVLAKYENKWYRAEVVDIDEVKRTAEVFYIDYGNRQTVPLSKLARCSEYVGKLAPLAQQFRLADISIIPNEEEIKLRGMGMLCDMILEKELNVVVVDHYEDLVIRFQDEPYSDIPQILANVHCVEVKTSSI